MRLVSKLAFPLIVCVTSTSEKHGIEEYCAFSAFTIQRFIDILCAFPPKSRRSSKNSPLASNVPLMYITYSQLECQQAVKRGGSDGNNS
jgi:hypothetical protein